MRILLLALLVAVAAAEDPVRVGAPEAPGLCLDCRTGGGVHGIAFSRDGKRLATGHNSEFRIWDAKSGKPERTIPARATVYGFHWFEDGKRLAWSGKGTVVAVHDLATDTEQLDARGINPAVGFFLAADDRGTTLITASAHPGREVIVWELPALRERRRLEARAMVWDAVVSGDGKHVVAADFEGGVSVWETATGKLLWRRKAHRSAAFAVALSPDGKTIASGGGAPDRTVRLWDLATGKEQAAWKVGFVVRTLAFAPDGKRVAVGGNVRRVELREVATGKVARKFATREWVAALAFAPDGKRLAAGSLDATAWVWDLAKKEHEQR